MLLTEKVTGAMPPRVGRKLEFPERMDAKLPAGTFARMDAVRLTGEARTDLIRVAVEREIAGRELIGRKVRAVRAALRTHPIGQITVGEAQVATRLSAANVERALARLVEDGEIVKVGDHWRFRIDPGL